MSENETDLAGLFGAVTQALRSQQAALNEADATNHNHGDHMVESFQIVTTALEQKRAALPAEQLAYASAQLEQSAASGSAQRYAARLRQAASQLEGQPGLTDSNALALVQTLLGESPSPTRSVLLRGKAKSGSGIGSLIAAGSAYLQAKKDGDSSLDALMKAVGAGGQSGKASPSAQSGGVVGQVLLEALSQMLGLDRPATKPKPKPKKPAAKPKPESKKPARKPAAKPKPKPKPEVKKPARKPAAKPTAKPAVKPKPGTKKPAAKPKPKPKPRSSAEGEG